MIAKSQLNGQMVSYRGRPEKPGKLLELTHFRWLEGGQAFLENPLHTTVILGNSIRETLSQWKIIVI